MTTPTFLVSTMFPSIHTREVINIECFKSWAEEIQDPPNATDSAVEGFWPSDGSRSNFLTQVGLGQFFVDRVRLGQPFMVWV